MSTMLAPYPEMKDSGVPWLGDVPVHWGSGRLKAVCSEVNDQTASAGGESPYVALENVESWTGRPKLGPPAPAGSMLKRFQAHDILFGKLRPYLAKVTRLRTGGTCVGEFLVLRPRSKDALNSYIEALLRSKPIIDAVNASTFGAKMPRADWTFIGSMTVSLPPPDEQTAIVRFLDHAERRIGKAIHAKQKLLKLLEEQKQAIIHRAVTRGFDPNVRLKASGVEWLGDVPEHWDVTPLCRVLMQRKEKNDPLKTTNILSLSLKTGVIPYAEKGPGGNKAKEDLSAYMLAYPGDIVVNSMNVVVGSVGLSKYFGAVSPVYYMLRPRDLSEPVEFYSAVFDDVSFQRGLFGLGNGIMYVESKSSGKLNTIRLRIPMARLKRVLLPRPPPAEQAAIVEYLREATADLAAATRHVELQICLLREYRTRLIADVVTGKLDVREAAARLPEEAPAAEAAADTAEAWTDEEAAESEEMDDTATEEAEP